MQKMIEINNATVYRGKTKVFHNLSLEITRGCNTAILGPNGAGKSTLLKLLSCELYPVARDGSSVQLFGQKRWNVWELRSHLGIVRGLMQAGKTVILVTQHIHEIPPEICRVVLLKNGKVVSDGEKAAVLTPESLTRLFDTPIQLLQVNGFYQAVPGKSEEDKQQDDSPD